MSAQALLERLTAAGLTLTANGDRLRIEPAAKFTDDVRAAVVSMKAELLALLTAAPGDKVTLQPAKVNTATTKAALPDNASTARRREVSSQVSSASAMQGSKVAGSQRSHERMLERQRQRRATRPRIDYYPSDEAMKALDSLRQQTAGGNASRIIDRLLVDAGRASPDVGPRLFTNAKVAPDGAQVGTQAGTH